MAVQFVDRTWINWAIGWYFTATALPAVLSVRPHPTTSFGALELTFRPLAPPQQTSSTLINYLTPKVIANRLPHYDVSVKDRTTSTCPPHSGTLVCNR